MKRKVIVLLLAVAGAASALRAQTPAPTPRAGEDPLARFFFPPDLVLQHALEMKLQQAQRTTIVNAVKEAQGELFDLQLQMAERSQELMNVLEGGRLIIVDGRVASPERLDEAAVLAQVDQVLAVEREMKRRQMQLLIKIRNALTPEQHLLLNKIRAK
jgi:Spy/CpxP family protein refolding chaperone